MNNKNGIVIHPVEDESQVEFLGYNPLARLEQQQQRHKSDVDATTTLSNANAHPDFRSGGSERLSVGEEALSQQKNSTAQKATAPLNLPPMPLPMPQFLRSIFGFGELPPAPKVDGPVNKRKRKRPVVESSSPAKMTTLAGPSSPALSTSSGLDDVADLHENILLTETEQPRPKERSEGEKGKGRVEGHGDRIAWGTQDESEYRRLNRTESERLIDEQLIVRRAPREALPATQERTDYMDRFRSESYSPVQYTATEGQMNEFRRRMGLSPIQRLSSQRQQRSSPSPHHQTRILPMMELDDEATQISAPPSQPRPIEESFDESATQQSTCSSPMGSPIAANTLDAKADDSGFVSSSPRPRKASSSPAGDFGLRDALARATIRVGDRAMLSPSPILQRTHPSSGPQQAPQSVFESLAKSTGSMEALRKGPDLASSSEEDSDFDEATVVSKPRERRILALATQETQDTETQYIRIQETQLVPCSQEESSELDLDLDVDADRTLPAVPQNIRVAQAETCGKPASGKRKSVSKQINAAWFPQILESATAASSARTNLQEQSFLTDFFGRKPGGPAERAQAERTAREKNFASAVWKERRESRQRKPVLDAHVEGDDDDIDDNHDGMKTLDFDDVVEVEDSETEEVMKEIGSQTQNEVRLPCEGWVLGQTRGDTPTPVKQFRCRRL